MRFSTVNENLRAQNLVTPLQGAVFASRDYRAAKYDEDVSYVFQLFKTKTIVSTAVVCTQLTLRALQPVKTPKRILGIETRRSGTAKRARDSKFTVAARAAWSFRRSRPSGRAEKKKKKKKRKKIYEQSCARVSPPRA